MRIALRTSGGRGEYELAGRQGDIAASALFDKPLMYEFTPGLVIPGRCVATRVQGKPRIRLDDHLSTTHFYRLLAGVLLLPKPKREFKDTHGDILLSRDAYSMSAIKVDVGSVASDGVILRPTDLLLENADSKQERLVFAQRMARISRLWHSAQNIDSSLASLIRAHKGAVTSGNPDHKAVEKAADAIANYFNTDGDVLAFAERDLEIASDEEDFLPPPVTGFTHQAEFGEDDDTSPEEARIERVKQWRLLAVRGSTGRKFKRDVAAAYDSRCLFSGQRLPRLDVTNTPGVDSAHILPWSTHDIGSVRNGICLSKLCHWAFDEGILRLSYDARGHKYRLEVPKAVIRSARKRSFDLENFRSLEGPIPEANLPRDKNSRPSAKYLAELNRFLFGRVA